jgi:hypothetical protein
MALAQSGDPFPGNISELRPPHIRTSRPDKSTVHPRSHLWFPFFESPPAIPPQSEVFLTDHDLLTLVYPALGGSYSSGEVILRDHLRIAGNQLELEIFHIPTGFSGDALVPPLESGFFLGQLPAGEYNVAIRKWYLPPGMAPGFDPETFVPPANAISYVPPPIPITGVHVTFQPPFSVDDPPIVVHSSFQFAVLAVPEPTTMILGIVLAVLSTFYFARLNARRRY